MRKFNDDDQGYLRWLTDHPGGYVVNADRPPNASYLVLHRSTCRTISGQPSSGRSWTVTSTKVCGQEEELLAWAHGQVGGVWG
jgi:hypothetical protein